MKAAALLPAFLLSAALTAQAGVTPQAQIPVSKADTEHFSGNAQVTRYPPMPAASGNMSPALVEFNAGTRTHWHTHPVGQYLIITEGVGQIQEWGKPVQTVRKGDVVWFAPHVKHWHGASPNTAMSHIAVSETGKPSVEWLEKVQMPSENPPPAAGQMARRWCLTSSAKSLPTAARAW
ncbi:cupin domain-containing protein [Neisseria sp.]|uniref:cupin domain-containing protein n=1 Tax=Neisseria sp. TaxID=192066 RepID=UPI0026DC90E4|nr:cupin domain-containing protein [Neisseria sp.]MDO4228042.1 cupin domain-containing protein [Neisseria sp.]